MRVLIVDDEQLAREWLTRLLGRLEGVSVCGEAADGEDALVQFRDLRPDAVLLDVQIPGRDGLEVARAIRDVPVVFTTAHSGYAVAAFELDACDYLVKPIAPEQLARSMERARRRIVLRDRAATQTEPQAINDARMLLVHDRGEVRCIDARRVTRFRATDKYTCFRIDGEEELLRDSLDRLAGRLASFGFIRVHRAELVRTDAIVRVVTGAGTSSLELEDGQQVAVSRRYLSATKRALGL